MGRNNNGLIGRRGGTRTPTPRFWSTAVRLSYSFPQVLFWSSLQENAPFYLSSCFRFTPAHIFKVLTSALTGDKCHADGPHFEAIGRRAHLRERQRSRVPMG